MNWMYLGMPKSIHTTGVVKVLGCWFFIIGCYNLVSNHKILYDLHIC